VLRQGFEPWFSSLTLNRTASNKTLSITPPGFF
jgi:hypothetical protein